MSICHVCAYRTLFALIAVAAFMVNFYQAFQAVLFSLLCHCNLQESNATEVLEIHQKRLLGFLYSLIVRLEVMAMVRETNIVALLASFLEMPDIVSFRMCHQNGSLIIGLRRLGT